MKMKQLAKRLILGTILVLSLTCIGKSNNQVLAATVENGFSLNPYTISTGTNEDINSATMYHFTSDGSTLVPLTVEQSSSLVLDMHVTNPGFVILELYKGDNKNSLPTNLPCQCTSDRGSRGALQVYLEKGSYLLKFPQNTYDVTARLFHNDGRKLKNTDIAVAYCDHLHPSYFTYQAAKSGYLTISEAFLKNTTSSLAVILCDETGKELTNINIIDTLTPSDVCYIVKKGKTYKLKLYALDVNGVDYYQIQTRFTEKKDTAGTSKKKATELKFNSKASGVIYYEDSINKADWFKFTVSKKQRVQIQYTSMIPSGNLYLTICDSKGNILVENYALNNSNSEGAFEIRNANHTSKLPKGTYYLKITKNDPKVSGYYTVKVSKYSD